MQLRLGHTEHAPITLSPAAALGCPQTMLLGAVKGERLVG
jgi:hypothetical protein